MQFTDDVTPYEEMKIKLLNGSHLALTYLGFLKGYRFVHETMNDPLFVRYMRAYMDLDVTPQLAPVPGIDLTDYKNTLVERFFPTRPLPTSWNGSVRTARRSFQNSRCRPLTA
nr:hypothetical protein GCM10020185_72620 [Pseudomonas brassicacearum subsp. brassicacearum]